MKKTTLLITLILFAIGIEIQAQCIGAFEYVTVPSNNSGSVQTLDGCNWSGDWNNITGLLVGSDYEFTSDIPTDYLTFTDDLNNVIASGTSPLSVPAVSVSSGRIHIYFDASCVSDEICRETTIQCTTCTSLPEPDCATTPFPEDDAINVPNGDINFTWEAPTTGPTPTSYNMYAGETPTGDDYGLIGNFITTEALITITGYDTLLYWKIVPVNGGTEATGCPVWSFTTESAPIPPACGENFYDTGGASSTYGNNENYTVTICPDVPGDAVTATFNSFLVEGRGADNCWDMLYIFDGSDDTGTPITPGSLGLGVDTNTTGFCWEAVGDGTADLIGQAITATNSSGCLTFTFTSDGSGTFAGWDASISCATVGTQEYNMNELFTYYPNPVNNTLKLKGYKTIQNVAVYNMLGQEVIRISPNNVNSDVDMSSLKAGAFFVKVTVENATKTIKVIKK